MGKQFLNFKLEKTPRLFLFRAVHIYEVLEEANSPLLELHFLLCKVVVNSGILWSYFLGWLTFSNDDKLV